MASHDASDDELRRLYDDGVERMESGQYTKAVRLLSRARTLAGGAPLAGFVSVLLAHCSIKLGDFVAVESARMQAGTVLAQLQEDGQDDIAATLRQYIEQLYETYAPPDEIASNGSMVEQGIGQALAEGQACVRAGALPAALASYRRARDRAHERADLVAEALALTNMGTLCELMNQLPQSLEYLQAALAIEERIHSKYDKARTLQSLGRTLDCLRRFSEAAEYSRQAAALAHQIGDREVEANALNNLGNVARGQGQFGEAARQYEKSLVIKRALGDTARTAVTLSNLGGMYQTTGRQLDARRCLEEAIPLHRLAGDFTGEALAISNLAMVLLHDGRPAEALRRLEPARQIGRDTGDLEVQGVIDNSLGTVYRHLGLFDQAIELHRQAGENARLRGDRHGQGGAANNLALDYQASGDLPSALEWLKQASDVAGQLGTPSVQSVALTNYAQAATETGASGVALRLAAQARELAQQTGNRYQEAAALDALGAADLRLGDAAQAREFFARAVEIGQELGTGTDLVARLVGLAQAEQLLGQPDDALGHYARAMAELEAQRTGIFDHELRVSFLATATALAVDYADLLATRDRAADALHVAERAKARSLLELLAESQGQIGAGPDPDLAQRERDLLEELRDADSQLRYLRSGAEPDAADAQVRAVRDREQQLDLELRAIRAELRHRSPRYASLVRPEPWTAEQIRSHLLGPDTALLEYVIGEERGLLLAVTQNEIRAARVPSRKELEPLVAELRAAIVAGRKGPMPHAHELYQRLVAPAADLIAHRDLLVVPDGPLYLLPFAVLLTAPPEPGDTAAPLSYLIRDHALSYAQSASVAGLLVTDGTAAPAPHALHLAAYGDPVCVGPQAADAAGPASAASPARVAARAQAARIAQGCPRIPFTVNEVWEVADLVAVDGLPLEQPEAFDGDGVRIRTGSAATKQDIAGFIAGGPPARFLHLATHGITDTRQPQFSGLLFSGPLEDPGEVIWPTFEILNARIASELVVLSACDTGLGRFFGGEGVVGLSRAFLCAGAGAVCVSLWHVADASTPELMRTFYQQVLAGAPKRQAMRAAQLAMLDQPQARPSQWAPFVLFGEASRPGAGGGAA
jgi:CHAT domain-containing protein